MKRSKVDIMATGDFDTDLFEKKLTLLKDSQESIQALSSWCLERRSHHKKIVATWLQVLKKVKVEHRLTLFYLANDVIQYSKRKNFEFVESWGTTLQRATTMVRDEKVKHRILRIFKIWDQRQVYDEEFLADLCGLLSAAPKKKPDPIPAAVNDEFQAALLISTMRSCSTLEQATDARLRDLRTSNTDIDNAEELCASLKDRRHVEDAEKDVDVAIRNIENYVRALEAEIRERAQVLELLEQADQFYETQRGEVKIVTNAYRNFGSRVKNLKKKLDELLPTLVSPIPSPDINAPSPSPDSDLDLPGDDSHSMNQSAIVDVPPPSMYGSYRQDYEPLPVPAPEQSQGNMSADFTGNFSSFMGGNVEFDMRNIFNDRSATPSSGMQYNDTQEAKPIEVINMRPSKIESNTDSFIISNFLKSVLPTTDNASTNIPIPGLGLDNPGAGMSTPPPEDYRQGSPIQQHLLTSVTSGTIGQQSTPLANMGNCQVTHGTPLGGLRSLTGDSHTPSPYSSQNSQGNNNSVNMTFDSMGNTVNPLPPPPMPPPIFLDDENCYNKLPPKFPTWSSTNDTSKESSNWDNKDNGDQSKVKPSWLLESGNERWEPGNEPWPRSKGDALSETPESPPLFEKAGFIDPIEYDDSQPQEPLLSSSGDVDHRVIPLPLAVENQLPQRLMKAADVDHRNLISLTGSPANHNPTDQSSTASANSLWPLTDQDYRQQMQPGDIVESVDMEMSDEEVDGKQKGGRVLVDLRSQDRDMRPLLPPPLPTHLDMDMRMIPLPSGQMPHRAPLLQTPEPHLLHQNSPQFHQNQPDFRRNQLDFRQNHSDFHSNQQTFHQNSLEFRQNEGNVHGQQLNFHQQNQQEFYSGQPDFHQNQQQEFEFQENRRRRPSQDFQNELPRQPERYQSMPVDHHQQDSPGFHRNERGRGRGFRGNRRDRYGEDHNQQQRNLNQLNNRRPKHLEGQRLSLDGLPNNRPYLLKPPETVIVLDDDGRPIRKPQRVDNNDHMPANQEHQPEDKPRMNPDFSSEQRHIPPTSITDQRPQLGSPRVGGPPPGQGLLPTPLLPREQVAPSRISEDNVSPRPLIDQVGIPNKIPNPPVRVPPTVSPIKEDNLPEISPTPEPAMEEPNPKQPVAPVSHDETVGNAEEEQNVEHPPQLSEQLEALMNFNKPTNNNSKQQSENGNLNDTQDNDTPVVKRPLLPNGPLLGHAGLTPVPLMGPNGPSMPTGGPVELHPVVVYEYENANPGGFRPRGGGGPVGPFPPWRGGGPARGRGGFRGGPRGPWMDRGPRLGGPRDNFSPRGQKRGGQFRGAGFRGRGRGNNW